MYRSNGVHWSSHALSEVINYVIILRLERELSKKFMSIRKSISVSLFETRYLKISKRPTEMLFRIGVKKLSLSHYFGRNYILKKIHSLSFFSC